jgi:hypothetical protein
MADPLNNGSEPGMATEWTGLLWIGAIVLDVAMWLMFPWRTGMAGTGGLLMLLAVIHTWGDSRASR